MSGLRTGRPIARTAAWLENRNDKRQCVVLICERPITGTETGRTLATVVASEDGAMLADRGQTSAAMLADRGQTSAAMGFIKARLDRNTTVHADEAATWNDLHAHFDTRRVNHSVEYANADACVNHAESGFSRMRRAEQAAMLV